MGHIVVHEKVEQLRKVSFVLDQLQECHLRVNQLPRDRVEVDLDGELLFRVANVLCLSGWWITL